MLFDTLSPMAPRLSKVFLRGIVKWGVRDARQIEEWNPRLRFLERTSGADWLRQDPLEAMAAALPADRTRRRSATTTVVNRFAF